MKIGVVFSNLPAAPSMLHALQDIAKFQSDHVRADTSNKAWQAKWQARVADMVSRLEVRCDSGTGCSEASIKFTVLNDQCSDIQHHPTPDGKLEKGRDARKAFRAGYSSVVNDSKRWDHDNVGGSSFGSVVGVDMDYTTAE